jgi:phosphate uptake regulator
MTTIDILRASARELQQRAEEHQRLIAAAIEENDVKRALDACNLSDCPHRRELKQMLLEAVCVLEDTRKAFKSRQLEALRKKMIRVLAEEA